MKVLVAGGTGLVGSCVVRRLVDRRDEVVALGRRPTGVATEDQIVDFDALPSLPHADAAFCGLGTTIKAAGSQQAFRAIDVDAVIAFAEKSREAGVKHFVLVTAVGADADSSVFYARMKGEVERTVVAAVPMDDDDAEGAGAQEQLGSVDGRERGRTRDVARRPAVEPASGPHARLPPPR